MQDSLVTHAAALGPGILVQTRRTSATLSQAADQAPEWSITRDGAATARLHAALRAWSGGLFVALNRAGIAPKLLARMKRLLIAQSEAVGRGGKTLSSPPPPG